MMVLLKFSNFELIINGSTDVLLKRVHESGRRLLTGKVLNMLQESVNSIQSGRQPRNFRHCPCSFSLVDSGLKGDFNKEVIRAEQRMRKFSVTFKVSRNSLN